MKHHTTELPEPGPRPMKMSSEHVFKENGFKHGMGPTEDGE